LQSDGDAEPSDGLPRAVRALLREHIRSIEQLDLLLWLHARPSESHSVRAAAEALGSSDALAENTLAHLARQGLVTLSTTPSRTHYAPRTEQLAAQVSLLAATFGGARAEVLTFISTCALDRVRDAQGRAFAHAYLVHGTKKE